MAKRKATASAKGARRSKATAPSTPTPVNDDDKRELFLHHRTAWNGWRAKVRALEKIGDEIKKTLKGDGFTIQEFKIADELATQRGEIKIKAQVATRLRVARWIGHPMGAQLDMFAGAANAAVDPRDAGKQASMQNEPRKPPAEYAPDSVAYAQWIEGYNEHQATLADGFKKPRNNFGELADAGEAHIKEVSGQLGTQPATHQVVN